MKIDWHPNPFLTTVEIDERDKQTLLLYVQKEEYENILCELDMSMKGSINEDEVWDLERITKHVSQWGEVCNMKIDHDEVQRYIESIDMVHAGDCTCLPASCARCQAEDALGIYTLPGLGKHSANKIQGIFGYEDKKTIDEAIEELSTERDYIRPDTWPSSMNYEKHIPRWKAEQKAACEWLKKYKQEHGF
jgi:hypothetical protein